MEIAGSRNLCSLALITLLVGGFVVAGCGSVEKPSGLIGMTRNPPIEVGVVRLPNENPHRTTRSNVLKGKGDGLMLVFFGYTSCPDVCPTTLADIRLALADLSPQQRESVEVGMVTVDPKRDTGKVLNGYLGHFFAEDTFASFVPRSPEQLARAEKAFDASHELGKPGKDGSYEVGHTAQVFAVDSNGLVRVEWPFGTPAQDITTDLRALIPENR